MRTCELPKEHELYSESHKDLTGFKQGLTPPHHHLTGCWEYNMGHPYLHGTCFLLECGQEEQEGDSQVLCSGDWVASGAICCDGE